MLKKVYNETMLLLFVHLIPLGYLYLIFKTPFFIKPHICFAVNVACLFEI